MNLYGLMLDTLGKSEFAGCIAPWDCCVFNIWFSVITLFIVALEYMFIRSEIDILLHVYVHLVLHRILK